MPWWSWIYLLVFGLLSIAGIAEQFRTKQTYHALLTCLSLVFFNLFVFGYFMPAVEQSIGLFIIPMLLYVISYDWWFANLDLQPDSASFLKPLPEVKSRLNDMTALVIILPGYLAGVTVAYRVIMNV